MVPGMSDVTDVVCFGGFDASSAKNVTRVLRSNGSTWASGFNGYGELANATTTGSRVFVRENQNLTDVRAIFGSNATNGCVSAIIRSNGKLYFSGRNFQSALGDGRDSNTPLTSFTNTAQLESAGFQGKMLPNGSGITPKVVFGGNMNSGWTHTAVLDNTGTLWCAGANSSGQCGVGSNASYGASFIRAAISSAVPVVDVMITGNANDAQGLIAVLQDGTMVACGQNNRGSLGISPNANVNPEYVFQYLIGFAPTNNI
jgi:alpha-tubulin suppressor-like RCC1 family protein